MKIESQKIKKHVHYTCLILIMLALLLGLTANAASLTEPNSKSVDINKERE